MTTETNEMKKDMTRKVEAKNQNLCGQNYTTENVKSTDNYLYRITLFDKRLYFEPIMG
jgi:hypothetical protein